MRRWGNVVSRAPHNAWERYRVAAADSLHPPLPASAPFQGVIQGGENYAPPEALLDRLRDWLRSVGETRVLHFRTEVVSNQEGPSDNELDVWDITPEAIGELSDGLENVLTAYDFTWALFTDHGGAIHVGGSRRFFDFLCGIDGAEPEPMSN